MNKKKGWVSVHRSMLDDPQFKDPDIFALWVRLLLMASYEDKTVKHLGQTINIKRGQFITGRKSLSSSSTVQESKIQRVLNRWESEQQIEQQTFSKYRLISIVNYDSYQGSEQQSDAKVNTTNKIINKIINKAPFEKPTVLDLETYFLEKKVSPIVAKNEAEKFLDYYTTVDWVVGKNKKQMTNWKTAASGWNTRRVQREKNTGYQSKSAAARTAENIAAEFGSGDSS